MGEDILFYFAGYGVNSQGLSYLVPADAPEPDDANINQKCIKMKNVMRNLSDKKPRLKLFIIDACAVEVVAQSDTGDEQKQQDREVSMVDSSISRRSEYCRGIIHRGTPQHTLSEDFDGSSGTNWLILRASAPGTTVLDTAKDGARFTRAFLTAARASDTNLSNINTVMLGEMSKPSQSGEPDSRVQISVPKYNTLTSEPLRWQFKPKGDWNFSTVGTVRDPMSPEYKQDAADS